MRQEDRRTGVIARKLGMTRIFADDGVHVPCTVLQLDGVQVVSHKTADRDGYVALQLGAGEAKAKRTPKALRGHFAKANVAPKRKLVEFRVAEDALIEVGAELTAELVGADGRAIGQYSFRWYNTEPTGHDTGIWSDTRLAFSLFARELTDSLGEAPMPRRLSESR